MPKKMSVQIPQQYLPSLLAHLLKNFCGRLPFQPREIAEADLERWLKVCFNLYSRLGGQKFQGVFRGAVLTSEKRDPHVWP